MISRSIFVYCIVFLGSCDSVEKQEPDAAQTSEGISGNADFPLSETEVTRLKAAAQHGDIGAMNVLSMHYSELNDPREVWKWVFRAAEHGDCNAIDGILLQIEAKKPDKMFIPPEGVDLDRAKWRRKAEKFDCDL